jgi:hypothetical protein
VVADLRHYDEKPDPDPHQKSEKSDPDLYKREIKSGSGYTLK